MRKAQNPHRRLRFYLLFLALVGLVLLRLHSSTISFNSKYRRRTEEAIAEPVPVYHGALAAALVPCLGMIVMYLVLAMGCHLSNLRSHTALRMLFGPTLVAGLFYWPSVSIAGALEFEEQVRQAEVRYQREFNMPLPYEYTFSKNYFCRSADMIDGQNDEFPAY
ncbi:hypothetical protein BGZ82_002299, partial [Podila clonocystis]